MRETLSFFYISKLRALNQKNSQKKCVLTQKHREIQKNAVLLNENVKQNKNEKNSLTLTLMNSWVI